MSRDLCPDGSAQTKQKRLENKYVTLSSALGKWGRTQLGSDRFNRICLFNTVGYALYR